jgi:Restriction endonuclease S subunits
MAKKKQELTSAELLAEALVREEDWPYKVPGNWVWTRLGSVAKFVGGGTPSKSNSSYWNGTIPWASVKDIKGETLSSTIDKITEEGVKNSSTNVCEVDDLLLITRIEPGKSIISKIKTAVNQDIKIVKTPLSSKFMHYFMLTKKAEFISNASGSTVLGISIQSVAKIKLPLPPLAEQQRIVDHIESLFDKLDQSKDLIQEALDSFENRKAAILHQAFTGQLTKKWREEHGVGLESWEEVPFSKFCLLKRGYDLPSKERIVGEYPLVSSSGVIDSHIEYKAKGPGIITGRSGTLGKVYFVEDNYWPLNTTLYSKEIFDNYPRYIYYYLSQFDFKKYSSSTAVPTLNRNNFSEIAIIKPKYEEQQEIVRILDDLFAKEQNAKDLCDLIDQIEAMKKTILGQAFRGELGTNVVWEASEVELLKEGILSK